MASHFDPMPRKVARALIFPLLFAFGSVAAVAVGATGAMSENFTWSAELVSIDQSDRTVTLKTRLDGRVELDALEGLDEGDEILLSWTGLTWGAAISGIHPTGDVPETANGMVIAAQFVGTELDDQYLVYRVPVPQASLEPLSRLTPGTWVTAVSPRNATQLDQAVQEMRGYNDLS